MTHRTPAPRATATGASTASPSRFSEGTAARAPYSLIALAAYLFLLPFLGGQFEDMRPGALRLLLLFAAGLRFLEGRQPGAAPFVPRLPLPHLLFLGWAVLTTLTGANLNAAYSAFHMLGMGLLTYLLAADAVRRPGGREWLLGAALAGAGAVGAWALYEYRITTLTQGDVSWRAFATFQNPNLLATYLLPALFLGLSALLAGERPWILGIAAATCMCAVGLVLTGSRGAVVYSLPVALLVWLVLAHFSRATDPQALLRQRIRLGAVLLTGLLLAAFFLKPTASRVGGGATTGEANSTQFRILTWKGTATLIRERPVFGWGPGTWETAYSRVAQAGYTKAAHNGYLQVAAEMGIPGLLLWLAVLGYGLGGRKRDLGEAGRTAALVSVMLHNGVDYGWLLFGPAALTWTLLGARPERDFTTETQRHGEEPGNAPHSTSISRGVGGGWVAGLAAALTAMGLLPAYAEWQATQARMASASGDPVRARAAFSAAAAMDFTEAEWSRRQGEILLYAMQNPQEALPHYQEAVRRDPLRGAHRYRLARAYAANGQIEEAEQSLREAIRLDPNVTQPLVALAKIEEERGRPEKALDYYRRVVEIQKSPVGQVTALANTIDPNYILARTELARAAMKRREREAAREQVEAGIATADVYLNGMKINRPVLIAGGRDPAEIDAQTESIRAQKAEMEGWLNQLEMKAPTP